MKLNKGFTLIELLVVISIIGLLSSVVIASLNNARIKSRNTYSASIIKQYLTAFSAYYSDKGYFPRDPSYGWYCLGQASGARCFGPLGRTIDAVSAELQPYYQAWPDPSPGPINSSYTSGAMFSCLTVDPINTNQCLSVRIFWTKNTTEGCLVGAAINPVGGNYCYSDLP